MTEITGRTQLAGVIGEPVRHSRSPQIHNAAYREVGLDWVYVGLEVPAGLGDVAVGSMSTLGIRGLNVTMPHKDAAARACDYLSPTAVALGGVNTVVLDGEGKLRGDSTDGAGFLACIEEAGLDVTDQTVLVLGAGGAARAVVRAVASLSAEVIVVARRQEAGTLAASLAPNGTTGEWADAVRLAARADVLVNATPIGMTATGLTPGGRADAELPVPGEGQWAIDLVYEPLCTEFMKVAEGAGAAVVGGLGILVHQAALAFEQMTGVPAPLEVMRAAAAGGVQ
ncbi:MAG: shikimate dehydrogenase [Acidimicrobiia bacterium]|nr:shikimate dehydrogenase [Acidimicrobiia bacterium]